MMDTNTGNVYKIHNLHFEESYRRYMAEILPIRRKTLFNQSMNRRTIGK